MRLLRRSYLGPGTSGLQVRGLQATRAQEVSSIGQATLRIATCKIIPDEL